MTVALEQVLVDVEAELDAALREVCVGKWLNHYPAGNGRLKRLGQFRQFLRYLWAQPGWMGRRSSELLTFQDEAKGRQRYLLLDFMVEHAQVKSGTTQSMVVRLSDLRGFWKHNRVELPDTGDWQPHPTREPSQGNLTIEEVHKIIQHANLRDAAVFLTMLQGLMDLKRFTQFNLKYAEKLVLHIREERFMEPFRIDFLNGRKKNKRPYYTFIYSDALHAWKEYFEKERGWPQPGEPIALIVRPNPRPITRDAIAGSFNTIARKLKIKPPQQHDMGHRTGVAPQA